MVFCMVSLCCMLGDCVLFTGWYGVCRVLFFFKQKTAYEMRISDWSSDVCSSDLRRSRRAPAARRKARRRSALPPSARSPRGIFELRDAFAADRLDDARQHRYALAEPVQLFLRDAIMFRVARLHIGFLQLLEHCAVTLMLARPCVKQARLDILGLCAQESEVVDVRRIEAARSEEHT